MSSDYLTQLNYPSDLSLRELSDSTLVEIEAIEKENADFELYTEEEQNEIIEDYVSMFIVDEPTLINDKTFWYWQKLFIDGDVFYYHKHTHIFCTKYDGNFYFECFLRNKKTTRILYSDRLSRIAMCWILKCGIGVKNIQILKNLNIKY